MKSKSEAKNFKSTLMKLFWLLIALIVLGILVFLNYYLKSENPGSPEPYSNPALEPNQETQEYKRGSTSRNQSLEEILSNVNNRGEQFLIIIKMINDLLEERTIKFLSPSSWKDGFDERLEESFDNKADEIKKILLSAIAFLEELQIDRG